MSVPVTLPRWLRMRMSPPRWTRYSRPSPVPSPVMYTGAASAPTSISGSSRSWTLLALNVLGLGELDRRGDGEGSVGVSVAGGSVGGAAVGGGSVGGGSVGGMLGTTEAGGALTLGTG